MGEWVHVASTLEVFLGTFALFTVIILTGVITQRRLDSQLTKRLENIFDEKKQKENEANQK